jgi:N-acetylglucosaminyl-diphospho-decaprenol L-rhamnosyltransferase
VTAPAPDAPDVSIIVIGSNVLDEVVRCVESIHGHAGDVACEVIYVDNGSTDGTPELLARRFPDVRVIRRETNEGVPARNHGLRAARGRLRMFMDTDAQLTPGALPTMVDAIDADPRAGLVGPRLTYADGRLQLSARRYPPLLLPILRRPPLGRFFEHRATIRHHLMAGDPHDRRRRVEYVLGACQLFRAEAQRDAGEIDERIWFGHDDADWCFRMRRAGWDVLYLPDAVVVHDYRRTSVARPISRHSARQLAAHVHFQRKWWGARRELKAEGARMDEEAAA